MFLIEQGITINLFILTPHQFALFVVKRLANLIISPHMAQEDRKLSNISLVNNLLRKHLLKDVHYYDQKAIVFSVYCRTHSFLRENIGMANANVILPVLISHIIDCLLYTSPSPRDGLLSRMPSSA